MPPTRKLVLLALADHADKDGGSCFPSVETVSSMTGLTRRCVQQQLKELIEAGLIEDLTPLHLRNEKTGRNKGGRPSKEKGKHKSTDYQITLEKGERNSPLLATERANDIPETANEVRSIEPKRANVVPEKGERNSPEPLLPVTGNDRTGREPAVSASIAYAHQSFKARFNQEPSWKQTDHAEVSSLFSRKPDLALDEFKRRWNNYRNSTEEFTASRKLSLKYFCDHFDDFIDGPVREQGARQMKEAPPPKGYAQKHREEAAKSS